MARLRIKTTAERIIYRAGGLPVAVRALLGGPTTDPLQTAFARRYWRPAGTAEWSELVASLLLLPFGLLLSSAWFTWRNGPVIRRRCGKSVRSQVGEQFKFYFSAGVLPPWYYIFSLHDDGVRRAPTFIERFETKTSYFPMLKNRKGTPLNDKSRFAQFCKEHGIRCVETLMSLEGKVPNQPLPECDLFVKPTTGRGGRGAERWDFTSASVFRSADGEELSSDKLLERLVARSRHTPLIVQPRLSPHPELLAITTGALPTTRVLTCLDTEGEPEVIAAMLRTSCGTNRTVDNLHAGGIGALIDVQSGKMSKASNLGSDARLGWFSVHPDTNEAIKGRVVPQWDEVKRAAIRAHRAFNDRVVIGWDISILKDGPIFIEGNGNPDLDILQRFMSIGFREHRFAELLAFHLKARGIVAAEPPDSHSSDRQTTAKG